MDLLLASESGSCPSMPPVTEVIIQTVTTMAVEVVKHGESTPKHIATGRVEHDVKDIQMVCISYAKKIRRNVTHKMCTQKYKAFLFRLHNKQTYLPLLALNLISCLSKYRGRERS